MEFKSTEIGSAKEVLKRKTGGELIVPVTLDSTAFTSGKCAAGTAIDKDGKTATTSGGASNAVGVLLNDVYDANPNGALIKGFASINTDNTSVTSADIAALTNLIFE